MEPYIQILDSCGIHRATDLETLYQDDIRYLCNSEEYNLSLFLFTYTFNHDHIFSLDMDRNNLYVDVHYLRESRSFCSMLVTIFESIKTIKHIIVTNIHKTRKDALTRELMLCKTVQGNWMKQTLIITKAYSYNDYDVITLCLGKNVTPGLLR